MFRTMLCLVMGVAALDAETIRGVVSDPNGLMVADARVELIGSKAIVFTKHGEFVFIGIDPGEYKVRVFAAGFEPVTSDPIVVQRGLEARADITLQKVRAAQVQVNVIGDTPEVTLRETPGSAFLVSAEELEERRPMDANEVLRNVPGLFVREDSGPVGMRLNIGVRGLNPDRSRSLLVLEDGLPLSLAPYGEPEMYYSPPIDRMSRIEILKGSGSILYGPQTIGGVLNFVTPDPPAQPQGTLDLTGGQRGYFSGQASYGGTNGNTGWYFNLLRKQGDGWRDFFFDINDFTSKLNVAISDRNRLSLKAGVYDEKSNSTYLGLTESQFRTNPNFNAVPDDLLKVRRYSGSLQHQFIVSPRAVLASTVFAYTTGRNWRRQDFDRVRGSANYRSVVGDTSVPGAALYLRDSTGNNNREFDVAGAESRLSIEHSLMGLRQRLDAGVRRVYEEHRDRRIDGSSYLALSGVIREDEIRNGHATSGFFQNRIFVSRRLTVTPGLRIESYDYTRNIMRQPVSGAPADVNIRRGDSVVKPIPGLGVAYQVIEPLTVFAGVHRGFAPPRVKDAITRAGVSLELDAELSWNYEAGARLNLARGIRAETTWFETDFENQIIPAAQSGGATTTLINGGETLHRGAEFSIAADWSAVTGRPVGLWSEFRHTWLSSARFTNGIFAGNRLPYAPESSSTIRMGYRHRTGFSVQIDGARVGEQFADNSQTVTPSADGTIGLMPSYWVWNAAASKEFQRERYSFTPYVTVKNLADELYISSRAPLGIQPGMFRQANVGLKFLF